MPVAERVNYDFVKATTLHKYFGHSNPLIAFLAILYIFHTPTKGIGMRKLFRQYNYKVYLVDEFRTSCMCSICKTEIGRCEKFQIRKIRNHIKVVISCVMGYLSVKLVVVLCISFVSFVPNRQS